jgi:hypothetical protein
VARRPAKTRATASLQTGMTIAVRACAGMSCARALLATVRVIA